MPEKKLLKDEGSHWIFKVWYKGEIASVEKVFKTHTFNPRADLHVLRFLSTTHFESFRYEAGEGKVLKHLIFQSKECFDRFYISNQTPTTWVLSHTWGVRFAFFLFFFFFFCQNLIVILIQLRYTGLTSNIVSVVVWYQLLLKKPHFSFNVSLNIGNPLFSAILFRTQSIFLR